MADLRGPQASNDADLQVASNPGRRRFLPWVAAVIALGGGIAIWGASQARVSASTPVGGRKTVRLPDGGTLELNTDTQVSWKFDKSDRHIWLERGEIALTAVSESRPYLLYAAGQTVTLAAGEMNARLRGVAVDLTVLKGACTITEHPTAGQANTGTAVTAGQSALGTAGGVRVRRLSDSDQQFATGWRQGELVLEGQTLGTAVGEYNRYLKDKIMVADPELAGIRLGGRFATQDPTDFLASLQSSFGIHAQRLQDGTIALTR